MAKSVFKIIEWHQYGITREGAKAAVDRAGESLRDLRGAEVVLANLSAHQWKIRGKSRK